ncbi:hypothetical protein Dda_4306 [Drechslerella dactyloides]|uniref:Uncharacterized protein n=1 Tax=Drechslerella dactyloides TaxID=74499 RepID=A0AAD6IZZ0_DREDA|nr:hypothetical protein Dda_4306 [Drechslerella dactyloides]
MKMKATMPQTLLLPEAVALGRFVTNTKSPAEEFFDSGLLVNNVTRGNVLVTPRNNFREVLECTSGTSAQSALTTVISSHSTFETLDRIQIEGLVNKTYQLENSTAIFESICEDPGTRKWLIKMIGRGRSVHMVVGGKPLYDETTRCATMPKSTRVVAAIIMTLIYEDALLLSVTVQHVLLNNANASVTLQKITMDHVNPVPDNLLQIRHE